MLELVAQRRQRGQRVAREAPVVLARGEQIGHALAVLLPASPRGSDAQPPSDSGTSPSPSCQARTTAAASTEAPSLARPPRPLHLERQLEPHRLRRALAGLRSEMTRSRGTSVAAGWTTPRRARPTRSPRHRFSFSTNRGASRVSNVVRRPGTQVQLGAQPLDGALLGGDVAQRDRPAQVDQPARVDARDGGAPYTSVGQHAEPAVDLVEIEHDARREVARDRRQPAAADVDRGAPREVGQHDGQQLAHLGVRERSANREVLQ